MKAIIKFLFSVMLTICILFVLSGCHWQSYHEHVNEEHGKGTSDNESVEIDPGKLYSEWSAYDHNIELLSEKSFLSSWSQTAICRELYICSVLDKLVSSEMVSVSEERINDESYIMVETKADEMVYFYIHQYSFGTGQLVAVWKDSPDNEGTLLFASLND